MSRLALLCLLSVAGCRPERPAQAEGQPSQITLHGVRLESFRGSELAGVGRAAKLAYQRTSSEYRASDAQVTLTRAGAQALEVKAPVMAGSARSPVVEGEGGVVARTPSGVTAQAPRARFDGSAMVATGEEGVRVVGALDGGAVYRLKAKHFELRLEEEEYLLRDDVQTELGGPR